MNQSDEIKRRIDAALAFAGSNQSALEREGVMSRSTLNRRRRGDYPLTTAEILLLAKETGVPEWFLRHGWDGWRKEITRGELREIADGLPPDDPPGS